MAYYGKDKNVNIIRWKDIDNVSYGRPLDAVYYGDHKLLWRVPGERWKHAGYYECVCGFIAYNLRAMQAHTTEQNSRNGAVPVNESE